MKDLVDAFSGLTFTTLGKLVLAFVVVDIARKLVIPKVVDRILTYGFTANETARIALIDLLGFLRRAEILANSLLKDGKRLQGSAPARGGSEVKHFSDLAVVGSEYRLVAPSLGKERFLEAFASEELQLCAIVLFDCYQRFSLWSQDNKEAFNWLLDNHEAWSSLQPGPSGQVRERLVLLNTARHQMLTYLFEILSVGYRMSELFCTEASSAFTLRGTFETFEAALRKRWAIDRVGIGWRRAFYAARERRDIFQEGVPLSLVRWCDEIARQRPDAVVEIEVSSNGTARMFRLPAMTDVALPTGLIPPQKARVIRQRRPDEERNVSRATKLEASSDGTTGARELELFRSDA